jgi:hypothetical protein
MEKLTYDEMLNDLNDSNDPWLKGQALKHLKDIRQDLYNQFEKEKKAELSQRAKEWRHNNKDKAKLSNKKYKQKTFICSCDLEVRNDNKIAHLKTKKHIKLEKK